MKKIVFACIAALISATAFAATAYMDTVSRQVSWERPDVATNPFTNQEFSNPSDGTLVACAAGAFDAITGVAATMADVAATGAGAAGRGAEVAEAVPASSASCCCINCICCAIRELNASP